MLVRNDPYQVKIIVIALLAVVLVVMVAFMIGMHALGVLMLNHFPSSAHRSAVDTKALAPPPLELLSSVTEAEFRAHVRFLSSDLLEVSFFFKCVRECVREQERKEFFIGNAQRELTRAGSGSGHARRAAGGAVHHDAAAELWPHTRAQHLHTTGERSFALCIVITPAFR